MKGNVKALTKDELRYILDRYEFKLVDGYVIVLTNGRKTLHDATKGFSLLLPLERRRIKITKDAIDFWSEKYIDEYSLIEVQNAINTLIMTFQTVTQEHIAGQLERNRSKSDNAY